MSEGVNHLIEIDVSAALVRGEHDHGMNFTHLSPTNVGMRVAELGRRRTQVLEFGGCSGQTQDVMSPAQQIMPHRRTVIPDAPLLRPIDGCPTRGREGGGPEDRRSHGRG